jgi:hypothetical protein
MNPHHIGRTPGGAEPGSAPIIIRDADERDLPAIAAIFNFEIAESAYVYAEAPLTLDDRRAWLHMHRSARLPVVVATDRSDGTEVLGWAALSHAGSERVCRPRITPAWHRASTIGGPRRRGEGARGARDRREH